MSIVFSVPDMTCGHCVKAITDAVTTRFPQAQVQADVDTHTVRIDGVSDQAALAEVIKEEGYSPSLT